MKNDMLRLNGVMYRIWPVPPGASGEICPDCDYWGRIVTMRRLSRDSAGMEVYECPECHCTTTRVKVYGGDLCDDCEYRCPPNVVEELTHRGVVICEHRKAKARLESAPELERGEQ